MNISSPTHLPSNKNSVIPFKGWGVYNIGGGIRSLPSVGGGAAKYVAPSPLRVPHGEICDKRGGV